MRIEKIKLIFGIALILFGLTTANSVFAQDLSDAFKKAGDVAGAGGYNTGVGAEKMISQIISVVLSIMGVLFLVLMIYGGYIWMMARDNEQEVTKAKNLITAAVIGVIVVVSAYAISYFVVENVTNGILESETYDSNAYIPSP